MSTTRLERASDADAVERLQALAFGPGAYARAAFRVREQAPHDPNLSFVTEKDGRLVGSVRLTPIAVGRDRGHLLGPLVVDPAFANQGYGRALVRHALEQARAAGHRFVILVGDLPYYGPFGFTGIARGRVRMPGPVDPARLLVAWLDPESPLDLEGLVHGVRPEDPAPGER